MKTKRKSIMIITTLTLVALMLVGATLAYLTDSRATLNMLGIGMGGDPDPTDPENPNKLMVLIKLTEPKFVEQAKAADPANVSLMNPGAPDEYEIVKLFGIYPNQNINKDSTITNIGLGDVYVRVQFKNEKNELIDINSTEFQKNIEVKMASHWVKMGDYYYYSTNGTKCAALPSGDLTSRGSIPVFDEKIDGTNKYTIHVPETADNDTAKYVVNLQVVAEAIQVESFTPGALTAGGAGNPWVDSQNNNVPILPAVRS